MRQELVALLAALAAAVIALVDGRRAVEWAAVIAALGLAPAAATTAGAPGVLIAVGTGATVALAAWLAERTANLLPRVPGIDPRVPVVASRDGLFGPRSIRCMGAAMALVGASWVAVNVPVGGAGSATGAVFAAADVFLVGVLRLLRGRSLDELATGGVSAALAGATGWTLEAGPDAAGGAAAAGALALLLAASAGWLSGRHRRGSLAIPGVTPAPPAAAGESG